MGLFGKLFSKKTDPNLEHALQVIAHMWAENKKPRCLATAAVEGAEMRCRFSALLEKFAAETGLAGVSFQNVVEGDGLMFVEPQLMELIQRQPDNAFLEAALYDAFSTPDITRQVNEGWPALVATYQTRQNTEDVLSRKAYSLSRYILHNLGIAADVYRILLEADQNIIKDGHKLSIEEVWAVKIEESALWFRAVTDMAHWYIPAEQQLFMSHFEDWFGYNLALQGVSPDVISRTMADRLKEYSSYREWGSKGRRACRWHFVMGGGKTYYGCIGLRREYMVSASFRSVLLKMGRETGLGIRAFVRE